MFFLTHLCDIAVFFKSVLYHFLNIFFFVSTLIIFYYFCFYFKNIPLSMFSKFNWCFDLKKLWCTVSKIYLISLWYKFCSTFYFCCGLYRLNCRILVNYIGWINWLQVVNSHTSVIILSHINAVYFQLKVAYCQASFLIFSFPYSCAFFKFVSLSLFRRWIAAREFNMPVWWMVISYFNIASPELYCHIWHLTCIIYLFISTCSIVSFDRGILYVLIMLVEL